MKKLLTLLSLLIFAAACTAPSESTNRSAANANATNARPAPAPITEDDAIAKERAAWEAFKNKDSAGFAAMLAKDQIYVGPEGVFDFDGTVASMNNVEITDYALSDWQFLRIDPDAFVVAYTVNSKVKVDGKENPPETVRSSSAWVNRDGKWVSVFHQECPVRKPTTPPPLKPAPSPSATSPSVTTGPDPEANEKAIWQALKNRNFDGFASVLAPNSIEVEPEGVYDKAGSVKMVSQFDFSKATSSDFKTIKLNPDAGLVTYLVKIPGVAPDGERHSTIWVNRSGKWQALFHHGTPVRPGPPSPPPPPKAAASPSTKAPAK